MMWLGSFQAIRAQFSGDQSAQSIFKPYSAQASIDKSAESFFLPRRLSGK